jgi:murein DD-endopeptidase MepM/ murein hydrolase activator NlpD
MQEWNTVHCDVADDGSSHLGVDIVCDSGTKVYAGLSGKIEKIDSKNDCIVISKDSYNYWYDGDGNGKARDTEIYYYNVNAASSLKEGNTVKKGDYIGLSLPESKCEDIGNDTTVDYHIHIKVYIDTDGYGWDFIDPRLVFE